MSLIPLPYRILAVVALVLALLGGTYYKGYTAGSRKADVALANFATQYESAARTIEQHQARINELSAELTHQKVDTIRIRTVKYVESIPTVPPPVVTTDSVPVVYLPVGWVSLHDASTRGDDANPADVSNAASSGITPNGALRFVINNYGICQENAVRFTALQEWIKQSQVSIDSINKARKPR